MGPRLRARRAWNVRLEMQLRCIADGGDRLAVANRIAKRKAKVAQRTSPNLAVIGDVVLVRDQQRVAHFAGARAQERIEGDQPPGLDREHSVAWMREQIDSDMPAGGIVSARGGAGRVEAAQFDTGESAAGCFVGDFPPARVRGDHGPVADRSAAFRERGGIGLRLRRGLEHFGTAGGRERHGGAEASRARRGSIARDYPRTRRKWGGDAMSRSGGRACVKRTNGDEPDCRTGRFTLPARCPQGGFGAGALRETKSERVAIHIISAITFARGISEVNRILYSQPSAT